MSLADALGVPVRNRPRRRFDSNNNPWTGVQGYGNLNRGHYTARRPPSRPPINMRGIPTLTDGGRRRPIVGGGHLHRMPLPIYKSRPPRYS